MSIGLEERPVGERLVQRVLGSYGGEAPGPLVVVVGAIHGNEPAGVEALQSVLARLERERPPLRGKLLAVAGNLGALSRRVRFVGEDLNRIWTQERVDGTRTGEWSELGPEAREQRELLEVLERAIAEREWERVILLDLHSTSAEGAPFSVMADTLQNRRVAFALPIPVILGLEERIEGTLLSWFSELGHTAFCVEGGQNQAPSTVGHHVAAIWITLVSGKALDPRDAPWLETERERLEQTAWGLPRVLEIRYRFPVPVGTRFQMLPGYSNFDLIEADEVLALVGSAGHEVHSPSHGLLLMPRYQGQGEDGFFIGSEVRRFWLRLSALLRRSRLQWILPLLPGVRRDPERKGVLRADRRVARLVVVELFHLFGYRWSRNEGTERVFVRRADRR